MDRKRGIAVAVLVVIVVGAASAVHYEGDLRPVGAHVDVAIRDSGSWYARPTLVSRDDDPAAVYVVVPELPQGAAFAAVRIDTHTREQTRTRITLGPQSPFRPYLPADVRVQVRGLRFDRPAFHLFSFPDGGGPGIHRVDSATGRIDVTSRDRLLLTRNAFNSSDILMMLSLISSDRDARWVAALTRAGDAWRLFLFAKPT